MTNKKTTLLSLVVALAAMVACWSTTALAQTSRTGPGSDDSPILALADSMPMKGARAIVLFRAQPTGRNIIVLPGQSARAVDVGAALALLARLQREHAGDNNSVVVPVSGMTPTRPIAGARVAAWDAILRRARERPVSRLGNIGAGRWLELP